MLETIKLEREKREHSNALYNREIKAFDHLMLDIESLDTEPGAVILSIGAVEFDIVTGETGRQFYESIDLQSSIDAGFKVNANTLKWWMEQPSDATFRAFNSENPLSIEVALGKFNDFCHGENYQVWGNGSTMDNSIVKYAMYEVGLEPQWNYWNDRDLRTIVMLDPTYKKEEVFAGVPHDPVHDCLHQIKYLCNTIKSLDIYHLDNRLFTYKNESYKILSQGLMFKNPTTRAWEPAVKYQQIETGFIFYRNQVEFFKLFKELK